MISVVMAGGKGSRMNDSEKLLLKYKKPIVAHVIDALKNSQCFTKIIAVTSPNAPKTSQFLSNFGIEIIETSGDGYVEDLNFVLKQFSDDVLVVSGDLPLLDENIIQQIILKKDSKFDWISFLVTKNFLDSLKISGEFSIDFQGEKCMYTGVSIVNSRIINSLESIDEHYVILNDKKIAFNLNTKRELDLLGVS